VPVWAHTDIADGGTINIANKARISHLIRVTKRGKVIVRRVRESVSKCAQPKVFADTSECLFSIIANPLTCCELTNYVLRTRLLLIMTAVEYLNEPLAQWLALGEVVS